VSWSPLAMVVLPEQGGPQMTTTVGISDRPLSRASLGSEVIEAALEASPGRARVLTLSNDLALSCEGVRRPPRNLADPI
jgi:hypothetical protein